METKEITAKRSQEFSNAQEKVYEALKGRKFQIVKTVHGAGLLCNCCGKKSRVPHSTFAVVLNEKKETKRIAAGCLRLYFGIDLKPKSGGNRKSRITL